MLKHPKIASPISHLFSNKEDADKIIKVSDCLECRDVNLLSSFPQQEVFHCEIEPIHELGEKEFEYLASVKKAKLDLQLISFHMASCYDAPIIKNHQFIPGGNKLSRVQLLKNVSQNLSIFKNIFGPEIKIAIENNNNYKTDAYDIITEPEFISEVINQNNIELLLDTAHAKISAENQGASFKSYINKLPLDKIIQIHISRVGRNEKNEIVDSHELPNDADVSETLELINSYSSVKYLTVEYYKNTDVLVNFLKTLKERINGK